MGDVQTSDDTAASGAAGPGDPSGSARLAAQRLAELTGVERHDVAVVLGSGWGAAAAPLGEPSVQLSTTNCPASTAPPPSGTPAR